MWYLIYHKDQFVNLSQKWTQQIFINVISIFDCHN